MKHLVKFSFLTLLLFQTMACATANSFGTRQEVKDFLHDISKKHALDYQQLETLLSQYDTDQVILDAISRPAEGKPWYQYRPIFIQESRIKGGVKFWNEHQAWLDKAEEAYGVPAAMIVAIIGVETRYGGYTGKRHTLRSLATLAFDYPPRSAFFKGELEQLFVLAKEQQFDLASLEGSYAGALGIPQFIPTSYRKWAIDFDQDGKIDLIHSPADAIGSVANYFKAHGWQPKQPVVEPVNVSQEQAQPFIYNGLNLKHTIGELSMANINGREPASTDDKVKLLELEGETAPEYWLAYQNFYVISRYNHSALYSLAAYQLSQEITQRRAEK